MAIGQQRINPHRPGQTAGIAERLTQFLNNFRVKRQQADLLELE
jgi:hypothetical protein